jgi:SHS2 domain-containing protein
MSNFNPLITPDAGFEEVEHTADWAYHIWAPDHLQLFLQAAKGLYALVGAKFASNPFTSHTLSLQGIDYESLLIVWLNELLYFHSSQNLGFNHIHITRLAPSVLEATLKGSAILQWQKDIKAATYHNLAITQTPSGWEATVVLDV